MTERRRPNSSLRLSPEELALLKQAAELRGFTGWSSYVRALTVSDARIACRMRTVRANADPDGPTLWDKKR